MSQAALDFTGTAGSSFDQERDGARLGAQLARVRDLMLDGRARTVAEIAELTGDPEPSVSAQLRHLRKARFGGYDVRKRVRTPPALFEYFIDSGAARTPPASGAAPVVGRGSLPTPLITYERDEHAPVVSQRHTTSSRRPGVDIHGSVRVLPPGAVQVQVTSVCPCGSSRAVHCKCGVTYCGAFGHPEHRCGGAS